QVAAIIALPIDAINLVIAPYLSKFFVEKKMDHFQLLTSGGALVAAMCALLGATAFLLFGRQMIGVAFGAEFLGAYAPALILCVGQILLATMGSLVTVANMTRNEG